MKERERGTVTLPGYEGVQSRRVIGNHNLETGAYVRKDRLWAEVRREDTESMELNTEQSGSMGCSDRKSREDGEPVRVPGKKPERN